MCCVLRKFGNPSARPKAYKTHCLSRSGILAVHWCEMIFGHSELEPWNDFDMGSAMFGPLPAVYVSLELAASGKVFAPQLKEIVAGYSALRS